MVDYWRDGPVELLGVVATEGCEVACEALFEKLVRGQFFNGPDTFEEKWRVRFENCVGLDDPCALSWGHSSRGILGNGLTPKRGCLCGALHRFHPNHFTFA